MKNKLVAFVLLAFVLSQVTKAQSRLEYKLKTGDSVQVYQVANQRIIQKLNNTSHEITNNLESRFTFAVTAVSDSVYTLDFKFHFFKLEVTSNMYGTIMSVDTSKPSDTTDVEAKIFAGLKGAVLNIRLRKTGEIISVKGTDKMIANMINQAGFNDVFTREIMIEEMKKEFGNESLANSFEQFTFIYPNKLVHVGSTWKNYYSGDLETKNNWVLKDKNQVLSINGTAEISLNNQTDGFKMLVNGIQKTTLTADAKSGFVKTMTVVSKTDGYSVSLQNDTVKIPTTINSNTTYKSKLYVQ